MRSLNKAFVGTFLPLGVLVLTRCTIATPTSNDARASDANSQPAMNGADGAEEAGNEANAPSEDAWSDDGGTDGASLEAGLAERESDAAGVLGYSASNLPAGTSFGAPGDLVIGSATCSRTNVSIDTATGQVTGCAASLANNFAYATITQSDMSLGPLQAAVLITNKFTIQTGMTVQVTGNLPLIVVALGDVLISGTLSATAAGAMAYAGGLSGPMAHGNGGGPGGGMTSAGGAGGGGFCGHGGEGGGVASSGGNPFGPASNVPLLGGSPGGTAGLAPGGGGGGAIQVTSATSIQLTALGAITAGGGGGGWQSSGGGSGGIILLEAPTVTISGTLAANGGGGGGQGTNGNDGANGQASASPAMGGTTQSNLAPGGDGSAGVAINGVSSAALSGGGGGGGAGRIRINTTTGASTIGSTAIVSPSLTTADGGQGCTTQGTLSR